MSEDERFRRFRYEPKRPPPEHGIRMKKAGTTWWGQRWLEALEQVLGADARRLERGRTYARAGRVHDLQVGGGSISAQVTGTRPAPYTVSIQLPQLDAEQWRVAIAGMAAKAQFSAELLAGHMPLAIDDAFQAANASLFPAQRADLATDCSCPDWGDPCKHVAATHYVLGEAFDRDPFLLFELRGKTRQAVLDAVRAARAGAGEPIAQAGALEAADEVPRVTLEPSAADYDRPPAPLPVLEFSFDEPPAHGALLRQLGAPAAWQADESPVASFEGWIRDAAQAARKLALAEPATEQTPLARGPREADARREPAAAIERTPRATSRAKKKKKKKKRGARRES